MKKKTNSQRTKKRNIHETKYNLKNTYHIKALDHIQWAKNSINLLAQKVKYWKCQLDHGDWLLKIKKHKRKKLKSIKRTKERQKRENSAIVAVQELPLLKTHTGSESKSSASCRKRRGFIQNQNYTIVYIKCMQLLL